VDHPKQKVVLVRSTFRVAIVTCSLLVALASPARASVHQAQASDRFADSIGVNLHMHFSGSAYDRGFATIVKPALLRAGVRHVRDGAYTYAEASSSVYYQRCRELAAAGIRFDLQTSMKTLWSQPTDFSKLPDVYRWCNGAVDSFEGVNEPDLQQIPAGYPSWQTQTLQSQKALWSVVKGNATLRNVKVLGPTIVWAPTALGNQSAYMDYGNWHPYPGGECPTCGDAYGQNVDTFMAKYRTISGTKPIIATETGYHNAVKQTTTGHRAVSERAAAIYTPRLLLEYFNRGFARTYLYELIDGADDPTLTQPNAHFGLLRYDGTEKPAFKALANVLRITSDPGPAFTPRPLDFAATGDTARLHSTLLQKRDGTYLLGLWVERSVYDTGARPNRADDLAARGDRTVADQRITLNFASPVTSVVIRRFNSAGGTSWENSSATRTLSLDVSDRLTFVQLKRR
jgi:hypothetical protein